MRWTRLNPITLAYIGDAVYELYIREYLISQGIVKVNDLQTMSLKYVSATSQRKHLEALINNNLLTEEEIQIYKRGRNAHGGKSKSTDIITYKIATGLECLIGDLYLNKKQNRIKSIMEFIVRNVWKYTGKMFLMNLEVLSRTAFASLASCAATFKKDVNISNREQINILFMAIYDLK